MKKTTTLYTLTFTEYYGDQCTGFDTTSTLLAVFTSQPDIPTLAPFVSRWLPVEMGEAIKAVDTLLTTGAYTTPSQDELEFEAIAADTMLKVSP